MMYNIGSYRVYEEGEVPDRHYAKIPAGEVGIANSKGLVCICKNDKRLIELSIYSHREGEG